MDIREQVRTGVEILRRGGLVAYPTDTVYGLGACAYLPGAVERVFRAKRRPKDMPLPLLAADAGQIKEAAADIPELAWLFIRALMPGALTVILRKSPRVPDIVTAGGRAVGIRIPAHPVPIELIRGLGMPIVGTSANLSGQSSPLTAQEVSSQLGASVDLIIDGGRAPGGTESTVIDLTGERPAVVRLGAIPLAELRRVYSDIIVAETK